MDHNQTTWLLPEIRNSHSGWNQQDRFQSEMTGETSWQANSANFDSIRMLSWLNDVLSDSVRLTRCNKSFVAKHWPIIWKRGHSNVGLSQSLKSDFNHFHLQSFCLHPSYCSPIIRIIDRNTAHCLKIRQNGETCPVKRRPFRVYSDECLKFKPLL